MFIPYPFVTWLWMNCPIAYKDAIKTTILLGNNQEWDEETFNKLLNNMELKGRDYWLNYEYTARGLPSLN